MSNAANETSGRLAESPKPKQQTPTERTPILVAKILISHSNPNGVRLPFPGQHGGNDHIAHSITAGVAGDVKVEIEYRPWMRHHRILRSHRVGNDGWKLTNEFYIPEQWAAWVPAE